MERFSLEKMDDSEAAVWYEKVTDSLSEYQPMKG
jgi:hypothetical protein